MTTSSKTISATNKATQAATAPRAGAVAGILFAVLFGISIVLIRLSVLAGSDDVSAWTANTLGRATLALRLIPFACIFFLWFVGVIRDRLGASEDKFFATVTLGSALVFVALTLASSAVTGGLFYTYSTRGAEGLLQISQIEEWFCSCSSFNQYCFSVRPLNNSFKKDYGCGF